jgi:tRNA-splicing ligase RtcB (3'-phosphate/5'-hydroxy nucleic acid ligase)
VTDQKFNFIPAGDRGVPVKAWTRGVQVEEKAMQQVRNIARLPFAFKHIAIMPDVHWGMGATVGSVIATKGAIVPAAVGVDLGCGMIAAQISLKVEDLPDDLAPVRAAIEKAVPHGRTDNGGPNDRGAWGSAEAMDAGAIAEASIMLSDPRFLRVYEKHPHAIPKAGLDGITRQLCTLGTGNHFIELCAGDDGNVWVMLHSGSRGVGNRIGTYFIDKAKEQAQRYGYADYLPDLDLAWLNDDTPIFGDYIEALSWAQDYAMLNRQLMLESVLAAIQTQLAPFQITGTVVNCHHNYAVKENHFGQNVWITRKGAVRARAGDLGIIPGSMGTRSYIVRGLGNPESFTSCSHGAGRAMSRGEAKKRFTLEDHAAATAGVECRKDVDVIDETPGAYKPIDAVIEAERDLIEPVVELRGVVCVKG